MHLIMHCYINLLDTLILILKNILGVILLNPPKFACFLHNNLDLFGPCVAPQWYCMANNDDIFF